MLSRILPTLTSIMQLGIFFAQIKGCHDFGLGENRQGIFIVHFHGLHLHVMFQIANLAFDVSEQFAAAIELFRWHIGPQGEIRDLVIRGAGIGIDPHGLIDRP